MTVYQIDPTDIKAEAIELCENMKGAVRGSKMIQEIILPDRRKAGVTITIEIIH